MNRTLGSLLKILDAAVQKDGAIAGNIQVYNPAFSGLEIIVQRGFPESFLECFRIVPTDGVCVCARAFRLGRRVTVFDVSADPHFEPYLPVANSAGFQSVQSTPILDSDECVIGIISTHFPKPHELSVEAAMELDRLGLDAARLMESSSPHRDRAVASALPVSR